MNVLDGIMNFLQMINDNWVTIVIIISLLVSIVKKIKTLFDKSNDEKIAIAKQQIKEIILKRVTDAEEQYLDWTKAGAVKRSQVIEELFLQYPVLAKVTNQEELVAWIDDTINDALKTMRDIVAEQSLEVI